MRCHTLYLGWLRAIAEAVEIYLRSRQRALSRAAGRGREGHRLARVGAFRSPEHSGSDRCQPRVRRGFTMC